jgi:hypothetical protein
MHFQRPPPLQLLAPFPAAARAPVCSYTISPAQWRQLLCISGPLRLFIRVFVSFDFSLEKFLCAVLLRSVISRQCASQQHEHDPIFKAIMKKKNLDSCYRLAPCAQMGCTALLRLFIVVLCTMCTASSRARCKHDMLHGINIAAARAISIPNMLLGCLNRVRCRLSKCHTNISVCMEQLLWQGS